MAKGTNLGWAKPDDPIYSSGPMISFRPPLTGSTSDTSTNTDGGQQSANVEKTIGVTGARIMASELEKLFPGLGRIAGPDDPIYSSGLTMTSVQKPARSTANSPKNTSGANGEPSSASKDPVLKPINELKDKRK